MADSNVIAYLYPAGDSGWATAKRIIQSPHNRSRYLPPRQAPSVAAFSGNSPNLYSPCLRLTFSPQPRFQQGLIFGCDPECDIVLPRKPGIGFHHGALTFDEQSRPIYQDLGSRSGSQVTYSGDGRGQRRVFRWILGGHPVPQTRHIVLRITDSIRFQLVICKHDLNSPQYIDNVQSFRQGSRDVEILLDRFDIARPETEPVSGADTPGSGPITLKIKVGEGAFAAVYRIWDVSTGSDIALKKPSQWAINEGRVNEKGWKEEGRIMTGLSHPNIVTLLSSDFSVLGQPRLMLEYVPGGTLRSILENLTNKECLQLAEQCLSALDYLHGQEPDPVVHRDIKPDNILVQARQDGQLYVKLADFGLTKDSSPLISNCGTPLYKAPEILEEKYRREPSARRGVSRRAMKSYTQAVDLWSMGVVLGECGYGLPDHRNFSTIGLNWCHEVVKKFGQDDEMYPSGLTGLIKTMVNLRPERRGSARNMYQVARSLLDTIESEPEDNAEDEEEEDGGSKTPTQAAYSKQYNLQPSGGLQTICIQTAPATTPEDLGGQRLAETEVLIPSTVRLSESRGKKRPAASPLSPSFPAGRRSSHTGHGRSRQPAEEYVSGLFDPLHPLGGGSSLAAEFAEEISDSVDPHSAPTSKRSGPWSGRDHRLSTVGYPGTAPQISVPAHEDVGVLHEYISGGGEDHAIGVEGEGGWHVDDGSAAANLLHALRDAE